MHQLVEGEGQGERRRLHLVLRHRWSLKGRRIGMDTSVRSRLHPHDPRDVDSRSLTIDGRLKRLAGLSSANGLIKIRGLPDACRVEGGDNVARLEAGFFSGGGRGRISC